MAANYHPSSTVTPTTPLPARLRDPANANAPFVSHTGAGPKDLSSASGLAELINTTKRNILKQVWYDCIEKWHRSPFVIIFLALLDVIRFIISFYLVSVFLYFVSSFFYAQSE